MARTKKTRTICALPRFRRFSPTDFQPTETVRLTFDEYEVLRLHDLEHFTQEEAAEQMQVSRPTVTEMLNSAHQKIADAVTNGKQIVFEHGKCVVCKIGAECPIQAGTACAKRHRCGASCRCGQNPDLKILN